MSASLTIVCWRDIPAQVIARSGRKVAKGELSKRFTEAIDRAAMHAGLTGPDAYLDAWRRDAPISCGDDLEGEAEQGVRRLDVEFSNEDLGQPTERGGRSDEDRSDPEIRSATEVPCQNRKTWRP